MESTYTDTTATQIRDPRLLMALRIVGWLVVFASLALVLVNIPLFYVYVVETTRANGGPLAEAPEFVAILRSLIRRFGEVCFFSLSFAVLLRSRDLMALLIAMTWALVGANVGGTYIEVAAVLPSLTIPLTILGLLTSSLGALLLFTLPDGQFVPRWSRWLVLAFVALDSFRIYVNTFLQSVLWSVPILIIYPIGIAAQFYRYRRGSVVYQHQFKWLLFGSSIVTIAILLVQLGYLFVPREYQILTAGIDEVGGIFLALSMAVALTRYRLYDINLFINRTLVYGTLALGLGLIFAVLFVVANGIIEVLLDEASTRLAIVIPALLTGALFYPTRHYIQSQIDRRVYHLRFDLDELERKQHIQPELKQTGLYTGRIMGGFHLSGVIARGGMGEVYKGFDGTRTAAVKILARELVDEEMVQRFAREAQTINALHHPRIVKAYSYGEIDGVHYLALEYIDGDDLRTLLKRQGRFALEEVRTIASGVADALESAHAQGIVHRDIKPSNIMLRRTSEGSSEAVLMDFGVAKLSEASTLTGDKAIGTIDYMSPEQIRAAQGVDRRADIYGLAVVCYELLTGERLYSGSVAQVLFAHLQQPPPDPRSRVPDLPASVANALLRALAKDPNDRFQSVSEFATALNS